MQPHPGAVRPPERVELACKFGHPRLDRTTLPESGAIPDVDAVGARVLRDHQQFPDAGDEEPLGFRHHFAERPRHEVAAHRGDDAERAAVVAAFGDLEVGVVRGRELDPLGGDEIGERIVRPGQMRVHRLHHLRGRMRPGDGEHFGMRAAHEFAAVLCAEAAGDDHLAVLGDRLADRVERFRDRRVDEAAGVDDDQVRPGIGRGDRVALGLQLREDLLGVDQCLRAAERNETHAWRAVCDSCASARRCRRADSHRDGARAVRMRETRGNSVTLGTSRGAASPPGRAALCAAFDAISGSSRLRQRFVPLQRSWGTGTPRICRASGPACAAACP